MDEGPKAGDRMAFKNPTLVPWPRRELAVLPPSVGEMIEPDKVAPDGKRFLVQLQFCAT